MASDCSGAGGNSFPAPRKSEGRLASGTITHFAGGYQEEYVAKAQPAVHEQIQKAGVRLAAAPNLAFR